MGYSTLRYLSSEASELTSRACYSQYLNVDGHWWVRSQLYYTHVEGPRQEMVGIHDRSSTKAHPIHLPDSDGGLGLTARYGC